MKKNNLLTLLLFGLVFSQTIYSQTTNITDSDSKKQGVWKKVDEKGNTKFEGTFVDDVPTGLFTYYYPNKKIKAKSVFFNNGKKTKTSLYNKDGIFAFCNTGLILLSFFSPPILLLSIY